MKYSWFVPTRITAPFTGRAPSYYPRAAPPFEWSLVKKRQRKGVAQAKAKGTVYKGRQPALNGERIA